MQQAGTGSSVRAALAYWLTPPEAEAVTAAVEKQLDDGDAPNPLTEARRELDAAAVRTRWFDPPSAVSHRRIARLDPRTIAARLTAEEKAALIACDPGLVGPLLDSTRLRDSGPVAVPGDDTDTPRPITLPTLPAGPVMVLDTDAAGSLGWALGELDAGNLRTTRPHPDDPAWQRAYDEARLQPVEVDTERAARRLIVRSLPALSSLALARNDLRPGPSEAVLLLLPFVVVIAPAPLAARVAEFAYPVRVQLVAADGLPALPGHWADAIR